MSDNTARDITFVAHGPGTAPDLFPALCRVYAEEYASSDDWDNDREMTSFMSGWPKRYVAPGFILIAAYAGDDLVGFAFGHSLSSQTRWWSGALDSFPEKITTEWTGRTYAIIEIITSRNFRRLGIAKRMHAHLVAELEEERVTLLVRLGNDIAYNAYIKWGYSPIGRIQPFSDGPTFNAMIRPLTHHLQPSRSGKADPQVSDSAPPKANVPK